MIIKQISVFVENRPGRIANAVNLFRRAGINISAMSLADAPQFGIFRVIVEETDKAVQLLKDNGFVTEVTDVVAAEVYDRPGGLAEILDVLAANDLNVEYMYAYLTESPGKAIVLFRFEDTERAVKALQNSRIRLVSPTEFWKVRR